jgi:hypothetical protein
MFNIDQLRRDIEALIREYPDLGEDEILRADMLDGETDLRSVLTMLFNTVDDNKAMIAAITERLQQLSARRARFGRRVEFLRELMLKILQSAQLRKIELPEATLSQRTVPPQIVGEVDADALPDDLCIIRREPNRNAIREALLNDRAVPGLSLSNSPPALLVNAR